MVWAEIPDFIAKESKNRDLVILTVIFVIFLNLRVFNEEKCDKFKQREIWAESLWEKIIMVKSIRLCNSFPRGVT